MSTTRAAWDDTRRFPGAPILTNPGRASVAAASLVAFQALIVQNFDHAAARYRNESEFVMSTAKCACARV